MSSSKIQKNPPTAGRLKTFFKSAIALFDFVLCIYLISLFFQGEIPGRGQLREAFRLLYSFVMQPEHLIITGLIAIRLSIYGFSRGVLAKRSASRTT
ncbi:MAG: hypothetical protein CMJ79_07980 [Planctomycetaceae bacterium]|nr:hypothetical protein [Planctomycetaceae bacterium]|tara:strand:- start:3279 stop:3569 length:291 start_codon:yes stop_codon:yes gene_type:complete